MIVSKDGQAVVHIELTPDEAALAVDLLRQGLGSAEFAESSEDPAHKAKLSVSALKIANKLLGAMELTALATSDQSNV